MARPGITRDQVFETADTLADEGIKPTVKVVRERIGGSFSTITPHLALWKEARGENGVANAPDMPERVSAACRSLWSAAWTAGQDMLRAERDGLSAARRELDQERGELAREITDLESALDAALSERDTVTKTLKDAEAARRAADQENGNLRVENARLAERVANTEKRADELRAQVERLEGELARLAGAKEPKKGPGARKAPPATPD